jgi:hypothetical protein
MTEKEILGWGHLGMEAPVGCSMRQRSEPMAMLPLVSTIQNNRNNYIGVHESPMHPDQPDLRGKSRA